MTAKSKGQEAVFREVRGQGTGRLSAKKDKSWRADGPQVAYTPREDATLEGETVALANIFQFVLERHDERKKGFRSEGGGEGAQSSSSQNRYPGAGCDE